MNYWIMVRKPTQEEKTELWRKDNAICRLYTAQSLKANDSRNVKQSTSALGRKQESTNIRYSDSNL